MSRSRFPISPRLAFSRKFSSRISTADLPLEKNAVGMKTPAGIFFFLVRLTVPLAYIYMLLIILRELCESFPTPLYSFISVYIPYLACTVDKMKKSSAVVEIWVFVETIFYIVSKLHTTFLQYKDPLEASLSAAPILGIDERAHLWDLMMNQIMQDCPVSFIRGWFFDEPLENITSYDVLDFCAWCMFEGRNQEHLTKEELKQLGRFVEELEWRIALYLYGEKEKEELTQGIEFSERERVFGPGKIDLMSRSGCCMIIDSDSEEDPFCDHSSRDWNYAPMIKSYCDGDTGMLENLVWNEDPKQRVTPRRPFQFHHSSDESRVFFTQLYENYKKRYEHCKHEMENFHPVQDMKNFMAEKRQKLHKVEEHAMAAASNMYENAYFSIIDRGSDVDKRLNAVSNATHKQLLEAWDSISRYKEKLKMADFIANRRKKLHNQMRGYRALLDRMHSTSSTMPTKQMANLMNKITQCNESHEMIERSAKDAFMAATGLATKNFFKQKEPKRYAKYTNDPLLGLATYPAMFHLIILGLTDGLLRIAMKLKGFEHLKIGQTTYYYHPGIGGESEEESAYSFDDSDNDDNEDGISRTPIVFIHGIGIGLGYYLPLIDELVKLRRPLFLPEIPYVSGFRPWISRKSILTPAAVVSFLTQMLASHGHLKASFIGHSYGTSWLSYMCKYAQDAMCSVLFLDPICFCLHQPCLTKSFVYSRADPGSISYMIRTDVIINWTIQRSFPWSRIILFEEEIPNIPCSIYLSENDALIPFKTIEKYFRLKCAHIRDYKEQVAFVTDRINVSIFRDMAHGDWADVPSTATIVAGTARIMTDHYEAKR